MADSAEVASRYVIRFYLGLGGGDTCARRGVLTVGDEPERSVRPDGEGDTTPGAMPPGTQLPQRRPSRGPGHIQHPLPDLSEQDAAKITRLLADERAELQAQAARNAADQPAWARPPPASVPHAFGPAHRQAVAAAARRPSGAPPWKGPQTEPSWHVLRTMVGPRPHAEGTALGLMSVTESLPGRSGALTRAAPDAAETDLVVSQPASADAGPVAAAAAAGTASPARTAPPADAAPPAEAAPSAEAVEAPAEPPDPAIVSVRETFAIVQASGDEAAAYFYGWLFAGHPELRNLFPVAMNEQRDRLFRAFRRIVGSLSTPEEMAAYLAQLGRDHRKYAVQPEMYDAVGDALMATLRAHAGTAFTAAAEDAWAEAYQAASSLMIAAADQDSLTAPPFWDAEVVSNEQRKPGISVLTVASDLPLPYEPGQHITVQTPRWPKVWRPYSVACRPREDGLMIFHVKAVPGGWVSNALVHHAEPGDELVLGPALGTMTLGGAGGRDLLCVAGGTGLSPIKAIIEQAIRESTACPRQIYLFYGARTRDELYDLPDLWHMAHAYHGFQLTPVTSDDPAFDGMQGNVGRVAARYMPHRECEAYVAGPPAMVREAVRVLAKSGLPRERIHYDDALLADG
jgi:NAD(P)H-flavin reductase/hemoglobin-like flavoprotein